MIFIVKPKKLHKNKLKKVGLNYDENQILSTYFLKVIVLPLFGFVNAEVFTS